MDFILEMGYDVKDGKMVEFQQWLSENEKEYAQSMPDGCEYIGTYVTVFTSEKDAGSVRSLFKLDSYGAQDRLAAAGREDTVFAQLAKESIAFMDTEGDWSQVLMKAVVDATLWE